MVGEDFDPNTSVSQMMSLFLPLASGLTATDMDLSLPAGMLRNASLTSTASTHGIPPVR